MRFSWLIIVPFVALPQHTTANDVRVYINVSHSTDHRSSDAVALHSQPRQNANHQIAGLINMLLVSNLKILGHRAAYVSDHRSADVFVNLADDLSAGVQASTVWPYLQVHA